MTTEYVVLGIVIILMGGVQIWLRHGPGSEQARKEGDGSERDEAGRTVAPPLGAGRLRSGRAWDAWTGILGFVGIVIGIVLLVMGLLGR